MHQIASRNGFVVFLMGYQGKCVDGFYRKSSNLQKNKK